MTATFGHGFRRGPTALAPDKAASLRAAHEQQQPARRIQEGDDLSARELEVLRMVADGLQNKEIARALYVSVETVRTHIAHLLRKLGARSRAHAVHLGYRQELLP